MVSETYITAAVEDFSPGLYSRRVTKPAMRTAHRHNEVELNYLTQGGVTYMLGGRRVSVPAGRLAIFWGSIPHLLVEFNEPLDLINLHVPLPWFLEWPLPTPFKHRILHGGFGLDTEGANGSIDAELFRRWHEDLNDESMKLQHIGLLEIQARLHRLAMSAQFNVGGEQQSNGAIRTAPGPGMNKVEAMLFYISEHYTEPITVPEIVACAGGNSSYAATLFRKKAGVSPKECLIMHRIQHAQFLLATRDANVLDTAMDSGFGSVSQFYEAFKRHCGMSPKAYRDQLRQAR